MTVLWGILVGAARHSFAVALAAALTLFHPTAPRAEEVTVFAAASLQTALDEISALFAAETGGQAVISYAGSSALARQIEEGAPADVFVSADLDWMDYLEERGLIRPETRRNLLGNSIVLIAPAGSAASAELVPGADLLPLLGADGRLAMADTEAVPAGKYGKAALESLGIWEALEPRVATAENVRAALLLVSRGEAPLGIVYSTDARADPGVTVLATFAPDTHPPIIYPVAVTAAAENPDATAFVDFLAGAAARTVFEAQGFDVLE